MSKKKNRGIFFGCLALLVIVMGIFGFKIYYPAKYIDIINEKSEKYNLDPSLVCGMIRAESRFRPNVVSAKGASGLMQVIEPTAIWAAESIGIKDFDYKNIFEPDINIEIGCWYLNKLIKQYGGNIETAVAAYNAGNGNVSKWLDDLEFSEDGISLYEIPFSETKRYLGRVFKYKKVYSFILKFYN